MTSNDGSSVLRSGGPEAGVPEGADPPPDAVALTYEAAASTVNSGSHAARTGYYSTPVDDPDVMLARVTALESASSALMVALAILRDASADAWPEHAEQLQAVVHQAGQAGDGLRDLRRLLPGGAWDMHPAHFDGDEED